MICNLGTKVLTRIKVIWVTMNLILGFKLMTHLFSKNLNWRTWRQDRFWRCGSRNKRTTLMTTREYFRKRRWSLQNWRVWAILRIWWRTMLISILDLFLVLRISRSSCREWGKTKMFTREYKGSWSVVLKCRNAIWTISFTMLRKTSTRRKE